MAEENSPGVAKPFVKVDGALGGCGSEVGGGVAKTHGHDVLLIGTVTPNEDRAKKPIPDKIGRE
jgi:hypothetical protein